MSNTALDTYLAPLEKFFKEDGVAEISINKPCEIWVENKGVIRQESVNELDFSHLKGLAKLVAQYTEQAITEENPLLSATLPNGFRIQIVFPPVCDADSVVMSIRKSATVQYTLEMYQEMGAFETVVNKIEDTTDQRLKELMDAGKIKEFLRMAVQSKKNIIISGGTSTGKTTFTNAILREIPISERLITCEDAREINLSLHHNKVHLIASKGGQGLAKVTIQNLIEACLRLRPDRIIVGELRGAEAFSFLRAINTGHPGSISTLHADTPNMAIEQLKLMVMQAGLGIPPSEIKDYIRHVVDIIVQLKRGEGGRRYVSDIYTSFI